MPAVWKEALTVLIGFTDCITYTFQNYPSLIEREMSDVSLNQHRFDLRPVWFTRGTHFILCVCVSVSLETNFILIGFPYRSINNNLITCDVTD